MLGRGNRISAGRIQYDNAAARGRFNIDIVHAYTGAPNHAKLRTGIQNLGGDFCLAAYDKRTEARNKIDKFLLGQPGLDRSLECAIPRKLVYSTLRNGIGD